MLIQIEDFKPRLTTLGDQFREINRQLATAGLGKYEYKRISILIWKDTGDKHVCKAGGFQNCANGHLIKNLLMK